jgi:hypothetical protein
MILDPIFHDPMGRISEKPSNYAMGISDNPNLFTGELFFLRKLLGQQRTGAESLYLSNILLDCKVYPGLYKRHPTEFQEKFQLPYNIVSHDEYTAILLLARSLGCSTSVAQSIVEYGEKHNWQFYDYVPKSDFFRALFKNPIDTIKKRIAYKKDYNQNKHDTNAVDIRHEGDIVALTFLRQPRDRAFYKLVAGKKPSFLETLWLSISYVYTTRRNLEDGSRGGTVLLAWFRMMLIEDSAQVKGVLKIAHNLFDKILTKKYGENYQHVIAARYFDLLGPNGEQNPVVNLIKEVRYADRHR